MSKKEKWMLVVLTVICGSLLILGFCGGCNTMARATVGAGQGIVEDVGTAYRHARHQVDYADRTVRDEDARMR
jgi:hypothetical protein